MKMTEQQTKLAETLTDIAFDTLIPELKERDTIALHPIWVARRSMLLEGFERHIFAYGPPQEFQRSEPDRPCCFEHPSH